MLALLGSWQTILDMFGDFALLAQALFVIIMIALGWFIATSDKSTRKATSLIEPDSNAGPIFAAIAIGFNNDPGILGIAAAMVFVQIVLVTVVASCLGKGDGEAQSAGYGPPAFTGAYDFTQKELSPVVEASRRTVDREQDREVTFLELFYDLV